MRTLLIALTLAVLAPVALAQDTGPKESSERPAPPELEKEFMKAGIAAAEGKVELAIEHYERVIRKWPDERLWVQRAYVHIVGCMMQLRRFDQAERLVRQGPDNIPGLDEEWVAAAMKEVAAARERDQNKRRAQLAAEEAKTLENTFEKMRRIWKEQGVAEEEIEKRIAKMRQDHEAARDRMRQAEEERMRLAAAGMDEEEFRRSLEEMERKRREMDELEWRKRHDRGMDEARKEFLRLAERLGIPPEKAERFLEEHRPGRHPEAHFERERPDPENARRAIEEAHEALEQQRRAMREAHEHLRESREVTEGMRHRIERLERNLQRMTDRVERGGERGERLEETGDRLERLERAVEKLVDKLEPVLRKLEERLDHLEREVRRLDRK